MPWWLDTEERPGRIRSLWISHTRFFYRGPKAWVVKLNLALSGLTLVPCLQFFIFWLFGRHRILGGDENILVGGFAFFSLALTSTIPYVVSVIPLLAAAYALLTRTIPLRVRQATLAIQLLACGQFLWMLHVLKIHFQFGPFGKP